MRDDLQIVEQTLQGEKVFVIGDALALEYYQLNEQEYFLLQSFDGKQSFEEIKQRFEAKFAPHQIRYAEIQHYLIDFHHKSLITTKSSNRGRHLVRLGRQRRIRKRVGEMRNVLAIRFRGINPAALFKIITPWTAWLFGRGMVLLNSMLMIAAIIWLGAHFDEFLRRLPTLSNYFSGRNLTLLLLVMVGMKILHELGHGIVFTKYGGRCHELGVMLLIFVPTLYVNTSDAWRIPSKYRRAAIAAAGVYVELCLAAIATFTWWFAKSNLVQNLSLNVMVLGSISALLFNGNPLLRFDGYYALSDLLEIPNLQSKSRQLIRNWFLRWGMGVPEGDEDLLPWQTQAWLALYAICSFTYRLFLIYFISFLIVSFFRPFGLQDSAKLFSLFLMSLLFVVPAYALFKYFRIPGRSMQIQQIRAWATAIGLIVLLLVFFFIPYPDRVICDFVIQPVSAERVYVDYPAQLEEIHVSQNQWVEAGDPIATMRNLEVDLEISELEGQLAELETQFRMAVLSRYDSTTSAEILGSLRENTQTLNRRLSELRRIKERLILTAPRSGNILPEWRSPTAKSDPDELEQWDGWALSRKNLRATFDRGDVLCNVGDLKDVEARLLIDQSDIENIALGQSVELLLDAQAGKTFEGSIESIANSDSERIDRQATQAFGGEIETKQTRSARVHELNDNQAAMPAQAVYEAIVPLASIDQEMEAGLRGVARIAIGNRTAAQRLYRLLHRTFRFDL